MSETRDHKNLSCNGGAGISQKTLQRRLPGLWQQAGWFCAVTKHVTRITVVS